MLVLTDGIQCTDRYIIVALDKLLLINIYLPSCSSLYDLDSLCSIFNDITCAIEGVEVSYTIAGGDLNRNVLQTSQFSKCINDNMSLLGLSVCNNFLPTPSTIDYTFAAETRGAYSLIDHFFVSNLTPHFVRSLNVIHDSDNFSDHLPLMLKLDSELIKHCCMVPGIKQPVTEQADHNYSTLD